MSTTTDKPSADKIEIAPPPSTYLAERKHLRGGAADIEQMFAHYPEEAREDAIWLAFFVRTRCNGEHAMLYRIARAIGLKDRNGKEPSDQYWYQVSRGKYFSGGGDVSAFKRYVAALRAHARRMNEAGTIPFVETKNWGLVNDYINSRRSASSSTRMGAIMGETGSQKTQCTGHYEVLNNHLETVRIEAPSRATRARLVHKLGARYLEAASSSIGEKELAIERFLKGTTVIDPETDAPQRPRCVIVDNVQRLLRPGIASDQLQVFNYIHELQEETGSTWIFTFVPTFYKTIGSNDPFWRQFLRRIGGPDEILQLQQSLPKRDVLAFAREFRVADDAAAYPILKKWASTQWGIGVFVHKLEKARMLANARRLHEIPASIMEVVDLEVATPLPEIESEGGAS